MINTQCWGSTGGWRSTEKGKIQKSYTHHKSLTGKPRNLWKYPTTKFKVISCFYGSLILCRFYTLFEDSRVGVATNCEVAEKWWCRPILRNFSFSRKNDIFVFNPTCWRHFFIITAFFCFIFMIISFSDITTFFTFFPLLSFVKNATILHYLSLPKIPRLQYCISHRSFVKWQKIKICRTAEMAVKILQYHLHPWTTQLAQNNQFIKNKTLYCCIISSVF